MKNLSKELSVVHCSMADSRNLFENSHYSCISTYMLWEISPVFYLSLLS